MKIYTITYCFLLSLSLPACDAEVNFSSGASFDGNVNESINENSTASSNPTTMSGDKKCGLIKKLETASSEKQLTKLLTATNYTVNNRKSHVWSLSGCEISVELSKDNSITSRRMSCFNGSLTDEKKSVYKSAKTLTELEKKFGKGEIKDKGNRYQIVFSDTNYTMNFNVNNDNKLNGHTFYGDSGCPK